MVDGVLSKLWTKFGRTIKLVKNACLSVLINNLGALPAIEMGIMTKEIVEAIQAFKAERNISNLQLTHLYAGPYMTSLDMNGISVSVLITIDGYNMDLIKLLEMSTTAPAWVIHEENLIMLQPSDLDLSQRVIAYKPKDNSSNKVYDTSNTIYINKDITRTVISNICTKLIENEPLLTEYDQICGDGDCGLVMKKGAEKVLQGIVVNYLDTLTEETKVNVVYLCEQIADLISQSMGGTSGVLLELFFRSLANTFIVILRGDHAKKDLTNEDWATALKTGIDAISLYGGANRGMRTMLDAFYPAYEGLTTEGLQGATNGAKSGVEATKTMEGLAGRSNYIDSKLMSSVPDPGAYAVYLAFQAIQESF
jgi:dihydroxyacetone kinase